MKMVQYLSTAAILAFGVSAFADDPADNTQNAPIPDLPGVSVTASDPVAFRGLSSGAFLLHREDTNKDLTVKIAISGSAVSGVDYQALPASVTIPAGFYSVGLAVNPLGGASAAPSRAVTLTIQEDPAYDIERPSKATVEIKGNVYEDQPPIVAITAPADNTSLPAHSALTITADASDSGGDQVTKVSFYANDKFLGSSAKAPFSVNWENVPPGSFSLFARAEDQFGKSTLSSAVHITVTNPPPSTATVVLTAPGAGSSFGAGANITLEAKVTSTTPVKSVSFYSGDKLLGTDDSEPYSFTWNKVAPGHYSLRAKVLGTDGSSASSESVKITVSNALPKVSITAPADKAMIGGPGDLVITADASDPDGSVAKVIIYGDGKALGSMTAAPYTVTWPNVGLGKHVIIATAIDSFGAFSSAAATITVTNPIPTVSITSPADGASFAAGAPVEIKADAKDTDGLQYVSFWVGDRRLGTDTTEPYSFTVNGLEPGTYTLRAHAIDKFGQRGISAPVKVTVNKP